ncbi:hypothetical protein O6H91_15G012300 [Diphasiastrum complanatum]|uniref:Uncharacterized protein n=1 Tax=Diphasiastrum complanatum TaxID=34168 RepID=A0ACC2BFY0_DIPCM|nr:hypothetical protein O6H91_15G012300 [Diphasiastrum complanatum]
MATTKEGGGEGAGAQTKKPLVHIPSHVEVSEHFRPQPPPLLYRPSANAATSSSSPSPSTSAAQPTSFAQAFAFVRNSEFYSPPPPAPPPSSAATTSSGLGNTQGKQTSAINSIPSAAQARNAILVSRRQQGNPILKHIRNVRWMFGDIVPDYVLGQTSCALYLSLRYHLLHPDYLYFRIRELLKSFHLRIVLCHVDVEDVIKPLHEVTKTALLHDCSLVCAWSLEECARYLETIKMYEHKPADDIQERTDNDYLSRLSSVLKTVRHVNKTDVMTLGSTFGTLAAIMGSSMEELACCPGIGEKKVKRLYDAFHEPFRRTSKQLRLSDVGISSSSLKPSENQNLDSSCGTSSAADCTANEANNVLLDAPHTSVRKALDRVYAKFGDDKKPFLDTKNETVTEDKADEIKCGTDNVS